MNISSNKKAKEQQWTFTKILFKLILVFFYPISRIREIRYYNHSPIVTEIIFDDGKSIKNDSSLLRTIYELYDDKLKILDLNKAKDSE